MKVELFCACDFASAEMTGKLHIIGALDTIFTKTIPATHALMCLAAKMRFNLDETGVKNIKLTFRGPENQMIMPPMETQLPVEAKPGDATVSAQLAVTLLGLRLPTLGEYMIDLEIENIPLASIPLFVRKAEIDPDQSPPK